jgi:CelD/BcsL family acetyltransferase involved in cellulose biosynthesis
MDVRIQVIDPRDEPAWDTFVEGHPAATVFHTAAWCRVLADSYRFTPRYVTATEATGDIRAAVPFMLIDSWLSSRRLVGLPFSDLCTPLVSDDAYGVAALMAAQAQVDEMGASNLEMRGASAIDVKALGFSNGTSFLRHIIPIDGDMDSRLHTSARRAIRKAEREGLSVRTGDSIEDMRDFYHLMTLTRRKHGLLPQPWRFFENLHRHYVEPGTGHVLLAEYDGHVVAGDLLLRFRDELVYKFNASDPDYLHLRPNNLLLWHAMQLGAELGCRTLDLGRCEEDNEGLRRFKLLWGSREERISHYYYPANPGRGLASRKAAQSALALFVKYAPTMALRGAGSALYRNFG